MRKLFMVMMLVLTSVALAGCVTPASYNFNMIDSHSQENMMFEDENIVIMFSVTKDAFMGVEGMKQYQQYDGLGFIMQNKTDKSITLDWNKVSVKDASGVSWNAVMHQGIKYNECSDPKNPAIIPPQGKIIEEIIPCYGVKFVSAGSLSRWNVSMLPSPRKVSEADFGVYMPLQIGDETKEYSFDFHAMAVNAE